MAEKRRQKLVYFGKRDDDIWEAIQNVPDGDQNYHMKEAMRRYFLSLDVGVKSLPPVSQENLVDAVLNVQEEDHSKLIDITRMTGLMIR